MEEARLAMTRYCKAQATINKIDNGSNEKRRELNERMKTYKSLLLEELIAREVTCMEVTPDGEGEPVYIRVKESSKAPEMSVELVMSILRGLNREQIHASADKSGHDFPKMMVQIVLAEIRDKHTRKTEKKTLSVSKAKERGFSRQMDTIQKDVVGIASDFLLARKEMGELRETQSSKKRALVEEQREVEDTVREKLKATDPVKMMTRVHMMQEEGEWVYYLRCREKELYPNVGVRRMMPFVESAVAAALEKEGFGREYSTTFTPTDSFWGKVGANLDEQVGKFTEKPKISSKITLDKGAPRRQRDVYEK